MAADRDYRVVAQLPALIDGQAARHYTRVGKSFVTLLMGDPEEGRTKDDAHAGSLVLFDPSSKKIRVLAQHPTDNWSATELQVVGRKVVYVESTADSYETFPWRLYVVDLDTGEERLLASDEDFPVNDPPWPSPTAIHPRVIHGQVYFVAVDEAKGDIVKSSVYRVPLSGGATPKLVVPGARDVYADGKYLRVYRDQKLQKWDPALGVRGQLDGSTAPATCGSYFNAGVSVTCSGKDLKLHIRSAEHGDLTVDTKSRKTGYLRATRRWVAFSTETQTYVVDMKRHRLMRMQGSSVAPTDGFGGNALPYIRQSFKPSPAPYPLIALLPK